MDNIFQEMSKEKVTDHLPGKTEEKELSTPKAKPEKRGKVLSIVSVKGGVGKTTLTANLGVLLSSVYNQKCLVIDGDLYLPSLGFHLNMLESEVTLHDVLNGRFPLSQAINVHSSGLHVVPGSFSEEQVSSDKIKEVITELSRKYDWVIVDTNPSMDKKLRSIVEASDEVLLISSPDFPAITGILKAVKLARELNTEVKALVLNRVRNQEYELDINEIERTLGLSVVSSIPEDEKIHESLSKKIPVVQYAPNSRGGRELRKLAECVTGMEEPRRKGLMERILGFLRGLFPSKKKKKYSLSTAGSD